MEELAPALISIMGSTLLSTAITLVIKRFIERRLDKWAKAQEELQQLRDEKIATERATALSEGIKTELEPICQKLDNIQDGLQKNTSGTIVLLREEMKQSRDRALKDGFISGADLANWKELYNTYKDLGANHFREYIDVWKSEVEKLPNEKPVKRVKREE